MIDINEAIDKLLKGKNAKYAVFICVGIMILIAAAPSGGKNFKSFDSYNEKRLARILGQIDGVGGVEVMITSKNNEAEGVIIVAHGVQSPEIKGRICNAAAAVLGIGPHKIEVFIKKGVK
ncbi:MAG: hypothetical protein M0R40_02390 [Firmicutes bacterium]|nr:hypothetical protein [Bacillota bacterium]